MAAGAEPRGRARRNWPALALVALLACAGARHGAADVISLSGNLVLGVSSGNVCNLTAAGLGIGVTSPSANLHVAGNAVVSGALVAGGTGNTSGSNLHISGTLGFSVQTVTGDTVLSGNSVVLADTSSGNLFLTLPSAAGAPGRVYVIKKTSNSNSLSVVSPSGNIDNGTGLNLTAGGNGYPFVRLLGGGSNWLVLDRSTDGVAALWTPADIATTLWLDAADSGTISLNGSTVSQWNDKSGNARHASQATASKQPTYTAAGKNGRGMISFDGTSDVLKTSSTAVFTSGNADLGVFAAYKFKMASNTYGTVLGNYDAGQFQVPAGEWNAPAAPYLCPWGIYNNGTIDLDSGAYTQNLDWIIAAIRTSGTWTGSTNGTTKNSVVNTNSVYTGAGTASVWSIGANTSESERGNLDLYEVVCVNGTVSTAVGQRIEGYLAWKWGLVGYLPGGHPYKLAPP